MFKNVNSVKYLGTEGVLPSSDTTLVYTIVVLIYANWCEACLFTFSFNVMIEFSLRPKMNIMCFFFCLQIN